MAKVTAGNGSVLLDAVELLTDYTGRMLSLPTWVDDGAVLGIQGGQDKVNSIVDEALIFGTPIAAVWLQDWYVSFYTCIMTVIYSCSFRIFQGGNA